MRDHEWNPLATNGFQVPKCEAICHCATTIVDKIRTTPIARVSPVRDFRTWELRTGFSTSRNVIADAATAAKSKPEFCKMLTLWPAYWAAIVRIGQCHR